MSVYNCNRHFSSHCSKTALSSSAMTASVSFILARLLTAPLRKALLFASNVSCDVFSALSASLFASSSIADQMHQFPTTSACWLQFACNSLALRFHVCFNERCTLYLKYCYAYWLLLNNVKCWHRLPMKQLHTQDYLTFGGGRDANLWDHSDPVYPSCIIWSDSYWADMLTSEIIVSLFTDIVHEIITCQATCNTNSRLSRWGSKSQAISSFFTCLNIPGFFQVSWNSRLL